MRALLLCSWLAVAALGCTALARLFAHDRLFILVLLNSYTFWLYLPAYAALAVGLVFRKSALAAVAVSIVICHIAWVAPDYESARPIPAAAAGAPHLRLFTANLRFDNPDPSGIINELAMAKPDVAFLQEFTPAAEAAMTRIGLDQQMPYRIGATRSDPFGTAILSRFPLVDAETWNAAGVPMTRATIVIDGRSVRLYNVHPSSPSSPHAFDDWNRNWKAVIAAVDAEPGDVLVAGDFNATQHSRWYDAVGALGLNDAQVQRGHGNATTWPNRDAKFLRPIRLDQVFASPNIVCTGIKVGVGSGSDHRPVIADFALL